MTEEPGGTFKVILATDALNIQLAIASERAKQPAALVTLLAVDAHVAWPLDVAPIDLNVAGKEQSASA